MANNLTDLTPAALAEMRKKAEAATPGPWDVYPQPVADRLAAVAEMVEQINLTDPFVGTVYLLNADGKCPATTGCGPTSEANAAHIAANHPGQTLALIDEIEALREQRDTLLRQAQDLIAGQPFAPPSISYDARCDLWQKSCSASLSHQSAIRICPKRDAVCPHGADCPYSIDQYSCRNETTSAPEAKPVALETTADERALWAKQFHLTPADVHRVLRDIDRLLAAPPAERAAVVADIPVAVSRDAQWMQDQVVAWLRARADKHEAMNTPPSTLFTGGVHALRDAVNAIERGDHLREGGA